MKSPWVFFFVWKEVFPWTTCFSPNHPTHCYTTWHTYFLDTMSYPRSSCRPVAWKKKKKSNFKCLACLTGEGLNRNRIPEGHSWQRQTISTFLSSTIFNSTSASGLMFLIFCIWNYAESTLLEIHFAVAQLGIWQELKWVSSQLGGQWCHWNSKGAF